MNSEEIITRLDKIQQLTLLSAKEALNVADVCLLTGLSKPRIYHLTSSREIPFYKPEGRGIFFKKSEITAWLLQNRQRTNAEVRSEAGLYAISKQR